MEAADVAPPDQLFLRQDVAVAHDLLVGRALLLVDKVADQKIQLLVALHKPADGLEDPVIGFLVDPVVRVHHLEEYAGGVLKAGADSAAVTAVFLVDRSADGGIFFLVGIRDLSRVVLDRTIVHDQDLDVLAPVQKRFDAVVHIGRAVVARYCNTQKFHFISPLSSSGISSAGSHIISSSRLLRHRSPSCRKGSAYIRRNTPSAAAQKQGIKR